MDALQEQVSILRSPHLAGVEFVDIRNSRRCWALFHETFDVCACRRADFDWVYRFRQHTMNGAGVGFAEPGEMHRNTAVRGPKDVQLVMLSPELVGDAREGLGLSGPLHFRRALADDPVLHRAILLLGGHLAAGAPALVLQSALAELVPLILAHGENAPPDFHRVPPGAGIRRAVDYLHAHFSESVSLDDLAQVAGVSRYGFAHAFRRATGLPPHRYQLAVRVGRARTLLGCGMRSTDVALAVGFTDQSHLIRHFQRAVGVTPARYAH
ncbi:MAG: helix-turn-helix transcriptional regulator [Burkholderiales bacterium]|nr:helix-turn-helix transcriptional regulator [Burkholderiales bacterium]